MCFCLLFVIFLDYYNQHVFNTHTHTHGYYSLNVQMVVTLEEQIQ